jgi:excisionase family DNA binding protein
MTTNSNDDTSDFDDLISVKEAAKILHVSESTVWRWIDRDILKAYRVGPKRVCLRRGELKPTPKTSDRMTGGGGQEGLRKFLVPMSPGPKPGLEELMKEIRALHEEQLAKRGGVPFPESWIDINEMRDERSEQL